MHTYVHTIKDNLINKSGSTLLMSYASSSIVLEISPACFSFKLDPPSVSLAFQDISDIYIAQYFFGNAVVIYPIHILQPFSLTIVYYCFQSWLHIIICNSIKSVNLSHTSSYFHFLTYVKVQVSDSYNRHYYNFAV